MLILLVCIVYLPALRGQFIWDDDYNILKSAPLRSLAGLWRIWFEPGATQQYYPLTHSSFWLDVQLWGLWPPPFHAENILLHAFSAFLVWRILLRLRVPGAWLGAALFGLHPIFVESVAWITERKNTLSGIFFLAAVWAAIRFWLPKTNLDETRAQAAPTPYGPWKYYGLALALYLCALWSKTATVGLPGVILLLAWWKRHRIVLKDWLLLLPFLALGLGLSLFTISIEHRLMIITANADEWSFSWLQRCLIAAQAVWFYLGKLAWPYPLMFFYPRWNIQSALPLGFAALAALAALVAILWWKRQTWGRPILMALGSFVVLLFPVLGFFNIYFFRYSFVCDHYLYLGAIGPLALAGTALTVGLRRIAADRAPLQWAVPGALLLALAAVSWRQTLVFYSLETLWTDALVRNPDAWMAHDNLGIYLSQTGRYDEADAHYRKAIELHPNEYVAYYDLGLEAAIQGNLDLAAAQFTKALQICPNYALAHYQLGNVCMRQGKTDDAIDEYTKALQLNRNLELAHFNLGNALAKKGKVDDALREFAETSRLDPGFAGAPFSRGNLLAAGGRLDEAVTAYRHALELEPDYVEAHSALGRVLAARGNTDEAIRHFHRALAIDTNSVEAMANLGNALVHENQLDEAVGLYREALRLDPRSAVLHYNLAVALTRLGKTAEAQVELAEAKRLQGGQ